jgi:hypothetical protein
MISSADIVDKTNVSISPRASRPSRRPTGTGLPANADTQLGAMFGMGLS